LLTYGPYAELAPGQYRFAFDYASAAPLGASAGKWDIVRTLGGKRKTINRGIMTGSAGARWRVSGTFTVAPGEHGARIEVRTRSAPGVALRIEQLRVVERGCDVQLGCG
jgi:hypothetical protein